METLSGNMQVDSQDRLHALPATTLPWINEDSDAEIGMHDKPFSRSKPQEASISAWMNQASDMTRENY